MIPYLAGEEPDFCDPDPGNDDYRFALGRIDDCTPESPPFVVIGMNPSHAREKWSDKTVNHVIEVSSMSISSVAVIGAGNTICLSLIYATAFMAASLEMWSGLNPDQWSSSSTTTTGACL